MQNGMLQSSLYFCVFCLAFTAHGYLTHILRITDSDGEFLLIEAAEEEGFDVTDQIEVSRFLKGRVSRSSYVPSKEIHGFQVNEMIDRANAQWEERNTRALERGEEALPPMLPLIRLKVRKETREEY